MPRQNLTQQFVQSSNLCPAGTSKVDYFDTKTSGLILKVLRSGRKTFYLRYDDNRGKKQEKKLGSADVLSLSDARRMATDKLAALAMGEDPFEQQALLKSVPTFGAFVADSFMPYIKGYKRSWITDESHLRNHILPALGHLYMDAITRRHLVDLFSEHRGTHKPGSTNRIIILCRYIFNCAIRWETDGVTRNPTAGIPLYQENNKRERYLTEAEAQALFDALQESDNPSLQYIIAMLLLTGGRKREVLDCKWSDFDLENRIWTVEFNKTGKPRYIPISDGLMTLLQQIPRYNGCDWVFPNPRMMKPFVNIFSSWDTARKRAGLPEVRIHDLRHSFASFLINSGRSLYEVQKILGHTQVKTTQRYAHLSQDSLIAAANTVTAQIPMLSQAMPKRVKDVHLLEAR
jgi:integrase